MAIINAIASVAVSDLERSVKFYRILFGRSADSTPMREVAEWKFERGGWLQVYELKERAGACSFTLAVSNLSDQLVHLKSMGIDAGEPQVSDKAKVVMIQDPDGNHIAIAEAIDPKMAR